MQTNNPSTQRLRILGAVIVVVVTICVYAMYNKNNNILEAIQQNQVKLVTLSRSLTGIISEENEIKIKTQELAESIKNLKENHMKDGQSNGNLEKLLSSVENSANQVQELVNKVNSLQQPSEQQVSDVKTSAEEWESLLSFLHMDAHGLCEDIFRADLGKGYTNDIQEYYSIDQEHDKYLASLNMTELFVDFDGHSSRYKEETYVMWKIAKLPFVKTVCETGFNAGHSVHLWLSAKPEIKVYSFDNAGFKAAKPMADYLDRKFPGRLTVTWGDSTQTLPRFIQDNPDVKCDLMIVDGGHQYEIATSDIKHFRLMGRGEKNILFMDNYPDRRFGNMHARAWEQFKRRGEVLEIFQCHYENFLQGFCFGRYLY